MMSSGARSSAVRVRQRLLRFVTLHPLLLIWLLALLARLAYVVVVAPSPIVGPDSLEYDAMARDLLAGHGFVQRHELVRPAAYPVFVAACYSLGGTVMLQAAQILVSATTAVLIG